MKSRDRLSETGIHDPEFLEWESLQVGELDPAMGYAGRMRYHRGPSSPHPGSHNFVSPMFELKRDEILPRSSMTEDAMVMTFSDSEEDKLLL